jgi:hypothetical protein
MDVARRSGVNANSGAFKSGLARVTNASGAATGENTTRAENTLKDNYVNNLQSISGMGRGESAKAISGLSDIANLSASKAQADAQENLANEYAVKGLAGAAVGAGLSMYKPGGVQQPNQEKYRDSRMIDYNQRVS